MRRVEQPTTRWSPPSRSSIPAPYRRDRAPEQAGELGRRLGRIDARADPTARGGGQAKFARVAHHIAGKFAGDARQGIRYRIAVLGLDDHSVHDRIAGLHLCQRFRRHAPLSEGVAVAGEGGDIALGQQAEPMELWAGTPPFIGGKALYVRRRLRAARGDLRLRLGPHWSLAGVTAQLSQLERQWWVGHGTYSARVIGKFARFGAGTRGVP